MMNPMVGDDMEHLLDGPNTATVAVSMSRALHDALREACRVDGVSMSAVLRAQVVAHLESRSWQLRNRK